MKYLTEAGREFLNEVEERVRRPLTRPGTTRPSRRSFARQVKAAQRVQRSKERQGERVPETPRVISLP